MQENRQRQQGNGRWQDMSYYNKNLWILAGLNLFMVALRLIINLMGYMPMILYRLKLSQVRSITMLVMSALLILVAKKKIRLIYSVILAYALMIFYGWLVFRNYQISYDKAVNIGLLIMAFSTITIHQSYRERNDWDVVIAREAHTLDLHISDPGQLFHPMVIGPHLEINPEISSVVERFVGAMKELSPIEVYIYTSKDVSLHMQETAVEAFREHFEDENRRLNRVLKNRTRRSLILFCIALSIILFYSYYDDIAGRSILWTVLGNMGGFFLWEIGNTYFRHIDDYVELEHALICRDAKIMFM